MKSSKMRGFTAVCAENESGKIVGFSWCYSLPKNSVERIDFSLMNVELELRGYDSASAVYGAETGVIPEYRQQGLASEMLKVRLSQTDSELILFRTKNPQMLRLYEYAVGTPLFSFKEESSYIGGKVYVFKK